MVLKDWSGRRHGLQKGMRKYLRVIKIFATSIIVLLVFAYVKIDQVVLFRYLEFIVL